MNPFPQHKFITKSFFEEILQKQYPGLSIETLDLNALLAKGENFSSDIIRATVSCEWNKNKEIKTFILKVGLSSESTQDLLDEFDVFHREIVVYRTILPAVETLLLSVADTTKLAPRALSISYGPKHFLFEDLTELGYEKVDRKQGLNYEHTKLVLQRLAKFHAATAVLYEKDPDSMKHHHFQNISPDQTSFYPLFINSMTELAELTDTWEGMDYYARKLHSLKNGLMQKAFSIYTWNKDEFNVLTHGDLWLPNTLFKYDENRQVVDCTLVDYSVGYFGSPAIDLCYLLFTSTDVSVVEETFDKLIQDYTEELRSCLKKFEYSKRIPSVTDIQIEVLKKGLVGVMFSVFLIPLRLIENTEDADLGGLLGNDEKSKEFRRFMFNVKGYRERITYLLKFYDRKGFLDVE